MKNGNHINVTTDIDKLHVPTKTPLIKCYFYCCSLGVARFLVFFFLVVVGFRLFLLWLFGDLTVSGDLSGCLPAAFDGWAGAATKKNYYFFLFASLKFFFLLCSVFLLGGCDVQCGSIRLQLQLQACHDYLFFLFFYGMTQQEPGQSTKPCVEEVTARN